MEDSEIVQLFNQRSEAAIAEADRKYRAYLTKIALNVLNDREGADETVNDTYLKAWNSIPPHCPAVLSAFLGKIARQLSIDRLRTALRQKRGGSQYLLSLDGLCDIAGGGDPAEDYDAAELSRAISAYLRGISQNKRAAFVLRYYFCESVKDISRALGESETNVKSILHRVRAGLKQYLESEGFEI